MAGFAKEFRQPYREYIPLHLNQLFLRRFEPTFRPEYVDVIAVDIGVEVDHPRVDTDDGSAGQCVAVDYGILWGDKTLEYETSIRVDAEGFVDDGIAGCWRLVTSRGRWRD